MQQRHKKLFIKRQAELSRQSNVESRSSASLNDSQLLALDASDCKKVKNLKSHLSRALIAHRKPKTKHKRQTSADMDCEFSCLHHLNCAFSPFWAGGFDEAVSPLHGFLFISSAVSIMDLQYQTHDKSVSAAGISQISSSNSESSIIYRL